MRRSLHQFGLTGFGRQLTHQQKNDAQHGNQRYDNRKLNDKGKRTDFNVREQGYCKNKYANI